MDTDPASGCTVQPGSQEFTNVPLDGQKKKKVPRRLIHFSDGVLEEYSTDEEEEETPPSGPLVDPKTLTWGPWMWYYTVHVGWRTLAAADFCGEKLAWFFGITTPKYQAAIDEFYRLQREEEQEKEQEEKAMAKLQGLSAVDVKVMDEDSLDGVPGYGSVEKY